jgi:hypothetical protein
MNDTRIALASRSMTINQVEHVSILYSVNLDPRAPWMYWELRAISPRYCLFYNDKYQAYARSA